MATVNEFSSSDYPLPVVLSAVRWLPVCREAMQHVCPYSVWPNPR